MSHLEREVVASLWQLLEGLLISSPETAQRSIGLLRERLPALDALDLSELPRLARLHMSSAANLMKTLRLMAPQAFLAGTDAPNEDLFLRLEGSDLQLVSVLIDLQLFHMKRAEALVAHAKRQLRLKECRL